MIQKDYMYKLNIEKILVGLLIIGVILGYTVSYEKFYFFHFIAILYYLAVFLGVIKLKRSTFNSILILIILFFYCCLSLIWTPNYINGLTYIFYLLCGFTVVIAIVNYGKTQKDIDYIFKVTTIMLSINFMVGLIETTGYFRLPISPYAIPGTFQNFISGFDRPSGFNYNLNNFGFVFAISFPFIFLYPNRMISFIGLVIMIWFVYKLQSKGFLLGIFVFFLAYVIGEIKRKRFIYCLFIGATLILVIISFYLEQVSGIFQGRAFAVFNQISRGIDLIKTENITPQDSTSVRAYFYATGLTTLFNNYGLGAGISAIASQLGSWSGENITSFHFFFLELLIDLGIIPFTVLMCFYIKLIVQLFKRSKNTSNDLNKYYMRASGYSLITIIPASVAPSNTIYILTFWLLIGFSLATQKITK